VRLSYQLAAFMSPPSTKVSGGHGAAQSLLIAAARTLHDASRESLASATFVPALELPSADHPAWSDMRALDESATWGAICRVQRLLDQVLLTIDPPPSADGDVRGSGQAAADDEDEQPAQDELHSSGVALDVDAGHAFTALRPLVSKLRTLQYELGSFPIPPPADSPAFMCYSIGPHPGAPHSTNEEASAERGRKATPAAVLPMDASRLLVLDASTSSLCTVDTASGEMSTLVGGRGTPGHADGSGNYAKFKSPGARCDTRTNYCGARTHELATSLQ
jgi:hypothetical protein